ncbi:MAG TPA: hypothetical protein VM871_05850 [Flavisolibacter sp.]|nr:hypothetical protein [Flavisolibacter sp.]
MMITNIWIEQKTTARLAAFVMIVAFMPSCSPAKNTAAKKPLNAATTTAQKTDENFCDRTVRYYFEKVIITNEDGNEKEDNTAGTMTFNPSDGKMTMQAVGKEREEVAKINLISCTLSAGMQSGEALYEIIKSNVQENGNTVIKRTSLKLTAVKAVVHLFISSESKAGGIKGTATQWDVMN